MAGKPSNITVEPGQRIGMLTVIERDRGYRGYSKLPWYRCICDCGKQKTILAYRLVSGEKRTRSCGCYVKRRNFDLRWKGDSGFLRLQVFYKSSAKARNIGWSLTQDQFRTLTSSACFYSGIAPAQASKGRVDAENYIYNGIDRLDDDGPYSFENCVPCCGEINKMKRSMTYERFISTCRLIAQRAETAQLPMKAMAEEQTTISVQ